MRKQTILGFTLIELMIVVVIVSILAAIAYPTFIDQIRKSRRADAKADLQALALSQEKWRANHPAYTETLSDLNFTSTSTEGYYTLSLLDLTPTAIQMNFVGIAAPVTGSDQAKDKCGSFAISSNGPIGEFGGTDYAEVDGCWR